MSNQGLDNKQHLVIAAVIGVPVALAVAYWVSWKSYDWLPIEVLSELSEPASQPAPTLPCTDD